jgi:SAM-dependent methyltransferase
VTVGPVSQYADDRNLRARQRLWEGQDPYFDLAAWVLDLAGVASGQEVLDVGCGNGTYLRALRARNIDAVGIDLSLGMLDAARGDQDLVNADAVSLPVRDGAVDVVLAPHMLYHVPDRPTAVRELRRVLRRGGVLIAVTNGAGHTRAVKELVEAAVGATTPGWEMRTNFSSGFSLENGAEQLAVAFEDITCVRPERVAPVTIRDAGVVADYVASVGDHYEPEAGRPWHEVVATVRAEVQRVIDADGAFLVHGDPGAFVCR